MDLLQSERRQRDVDDKPVDRLMRIVWDAPGGTQNHPGRQAQEQQRNVAQCGFPRSRQLTQPHSSRETCEGFHTSRRFHVSFVGATFPYRSRFTMMVAISLMRTRQDVGLAEFRRHWLDVHGPLVCRFPSLRHYVQHHVIASPAMNIRARDMRIDGFPILRFDSDIDRQRAHASPEMAACNVDFACVHRRCFPRHL